MINPQTGKINENITKYLRYLPIPLKGFDFIEYLTDAARIFSYLVKKNLFTHFSIQLDLLLDPNLTTLSLAKRTLHKEILDNISDKCPQLSSLNLRTMYT